MNLDGPPEIRGGIKGSFPIDGQYGQYEYLNWAAKFFADALMIDHNDRPVPPTLELSQPRQKFVAYV